MATDCGEWDYFVCLWVSQLFTLLFPLLYRIFIPLLLSARRHSSRYSHNARFSVACSGKENGFAIQSIQEQATSFTFFKFSVENKTFPTLMTLNKCSLKVYPSFSDERREG
jgi:hypothetical protein